jgi:hypothetical protein
VIKELSGAASGRSAARDCELPKTKKATSASQPAPSLPPPDADEQEAIRTADRRRQTRAPRLTVRTGQETGGNIKIMGSEHSDQVGWLRRLEDSFGTRGTAFPAAQLQQLASACTDNAGKLETGKLNAMLAFVDGVQPENELQAMLAVQMALTHSMALDILRRAQRVDQIPQVDSAGSLAIKLLRTFTMQVEALAKLQRGGEQIVKVVHVHAGGQAIVGTVQAGTGVGEGANENRNQPHAKGQPPALGPPNGGEVLRQDTIRDAMPVTEGVGQVAMPDARRRGR